MKRKLTYIFAILLFPMAVNAQDGNQLGDLQDRLDNFYSTWFPVTLQVLFDKPQYVPGDTARMKLMLVTSNELRPMDGVQIVSMDVMDNKGQVVFHNKVVVSNGFSARQIVIPPDTKPGVYQLVAYTNWMKNFGEQFYYAQPFQIAGEKYYKVDPQESKLVAAVEGGSCVCNLRSRWVVTGLKQDSVMIRRTDNNQIITSGSTNSHGVASLYAALEQGASYEVVSNGDRQPLPKCSTDGVVMNTIIPEGSTPVRTTIQVNENSALRSKKLLVTASAGKKIYASSIVSLAERPYATFSIPRENWPPGLVRLTVFDDELNVLAERLVISRMPQEVNGEVAGSKIHSTRDRVTVKVRMTDPYGIPVKGVVESRAFMTNILGVDTAKSLGINLLLATEFPEALQFDGTTAKHRSFNSWNEWLIGKTLTREKWERILSNKKPEGGSLSRYLTIKGKATTSTGKPLPPKTKIVFLLERNVAVYRAYTDSLGRFTFALLFDFFGEEEVFFRAEKDGQRIDDITITLDPDDHPSSILPFTFSQVDKENPYFAFTSKANPIKTSFNYFSVENEVIEAPENANTKFEKRARGIDYSIDLADYLLFPTMEQTIHELIEPVQYRKGEVHIYHEDYNQWSPGEPLYIIDGVITESTEYFMSLNPADVSTIKLISSARKLAIFDDIGRNGIVLVETKIPNNQTNVPRPKHRYVTEGLSGAKQAEATRFRPFPQRTPDLRSNLFWDPFVRLNENGEASISFSASDITGRVQIDFRGISTEGLPIQVTTFLDIVFQP